MSELVHVPGALAKQPRAVRARVVRVPPHTNTLDEIAAHGNRFFWEPSWTITERKDAGSNWITCRDGYELSVIAGHGTYCSPRPGWPFENGAPENYEGPFHEVEVMLNAPPEPWEAWVKHFGDLNPDDHVGVFAYVPVEIVRDLILRHGGER